MTTTDAATAVALEQTLQAEMDEAKVEKQTTSRPPRPGPPPRKKRPIPDPDQFFKLAKSSAVRNFNESRDPERSKPIDDTQVHISGFSRTMSHWKATLTSTVARNMLWEVTFNAAKNQIYVDAYRKISNSMIQLGEDGA